MHLGFLQRHHDKQATFTVAETEPAAVQTRTEWSIPTKIQPVVGYNNHGLSMLLLILSALYIGIALQVSSAIFDITALRILTLALAFAVASFVVPHLQFKVRIAERTLVLVLLGAILFQIVLLLRSAPGRHLTVAPQEFWLFDAGIQLTAGLIVLTLLPLQWVRRGIIPLVLITHFALGVWIIQASPAPFIDVFVFQQGSSAALLHGQNPYEYKATNIYADEQYYGAGVVQGTQLAFGSPYPPLTVLVATLGKLLGGDIRYGYLGALTLAGGLIAYMRASRLAVLAAWLYLFTPRAFFVIEMGWSEPAVGLFLAITLYCALNKPRALPVALGLFLTSKQYIVLAAPVVWLLLPKPFRWKQLIKLYLQTATIALGLTLPFVVWNVEAFIANVVLLHLNQPFRIDSLSYLALYAQTTATLPPQWIAVVVLIPTMWFALWRSQRTPAGFATAIGLILFVFFAFSKQAFCNYYFFILGTFCCALAAMQPSVSNPQPRT